MTLILPSGKCNLTPNLESETKLGKSPITCALKVFFSYLLSDSLTEIFLMPPRLTFKRRVFKLCKIKIKLIFRETVPLNLCTHSSVFPGALHGTTAPLKYNTSQNFLLFCTKLKNRSWLSFSSKLHIFSLTYFLVFQFVQVQLAVLLKIICTKLNNECVCPFVSDTCTFEINF